MAGKGPLLPKKRLGGVLVVAVLFSVFPSAARGDAYVVKDGQAQAEIVIAERPPRMVKLAASELQTYIGKITGAKLPIATQPKPGVASVFVGKSVHTDRLKLSDTGLEHGAFHMKSGGNWLALIGRDSDYTPKEPYARNHGDRKRAAKAWDKLTGARWAHPGVSTFKGYNKPLKIWANDERGSLNAVYAFLRSLGVRWYFPGEFGEILSKMKTIRIPKLDKTVRPDFAHRNMMFYAHRFFMASAQGVLWQLRLGLNWRGGMHGHGINSAIHHPNTRKAHPEYYMLVNEKRDIVSRGGKPCLSSAGLARANVEFARAYFDIYGAATVSVMPTDGYVNLCQCDLCRGKGTPELGYRGQLSDYVWGYTNRVAKELLKTHPDREVSCYAYGAYRLPPKKIAKLSPNVVVGICQSRAGFQDRATRKEFLDLRQAWLKKLSGDKRLYIWEYYLHGRPGRSHEGLPAFFPRLIAEDLRSLKGIGKGEGIEVYTRREPSPEVALAVNHLNCYVTARLWWDADQDVDALLNEYYRNFYGPAAKPMQAFIEYCEANWPGMAKQVTRIDKAFALLGAARKATGDTIYGKRIDLIARYMKPVTQLRAKLAMGR